VAPFSNAQVQFQIGMAAAVTTLQAYDLTVTITDASFVNTPTRAATLNFQGNYDWAPATSATDDANALTSLWTTGADPALFTALPWVRITTPGQTFGGTWFGQNPATTADTYLVSPPLHVGAGNFSFTFKHGYSFEQDATPTYYDGGVVELSTNGGASWTDLGSAFTMNGYTVTLYDGMDPNLGPSENPLKGRMAFGGGPTAGFPALISSTVNLATTYANSTVRIRFRIGSDQGSAATGWLVDDIAFTGLTDTPFTTQVDQRNLCSNNPPVANAGPAQMVNEGTVVTLDGSGSADPDAADVLSYHWTQLSGPTAALSNPGAANPTFTAPLVPADTVLRFQLVVDDGKVFSTPSTVDITDKDIPAPPPDMTTPPDMVTPNDLSTLPPVDMAMKADMATTPADLAEPEDMTPAPLPPDMAKKGGGGGGCSTTGDNTPASTALPLFGLVVLGFAFRRRTRRS
jgi:MYXO-CTERM domain-containing protein